jgi:hypothetical protein
VRGCVRGDAHPVRHRGGRGHPLRVCGYSGRRGTPPAVVDVHYEQGVALAPAAGGGFIFLRGSNFGPVGGTTTLRMWAVPAANQTLAFPGRECTVTEAHVTIRCRMGYVAGATLAWRVQVEGQNNTLPQSAVAPPVVRRVAYAEPGVVVASTRGAARRCLWRA